MIPGGEDELVLPLSKSRSDRGQFDHTPGLPLDSHYRAKLDLSAGKAKVSVLDVSADLERPDAIDTLGAMLPDGTYDLAKLLLPPP